MDDPGRYRVTLSKGDEPVMHGWWKREETARRKFLGLVGEQGSRDDARVTLEDTATGETLAEWPDD